MSFVSNLTQTILKVTQMKKKVASDFRNPPRNTSVMDRGKFKKNLDLKSWEVEGFKLLTASPPKPNNKHVVFFHGGAYILEATSFHQRFMEILAAEFGLTVTFIDYPKTPEHTFRTTHEVVLKAYLEILQNNPGHEFALVGDSAGGGLALALLQVLRDKKVKPIPKKTVLMSPWVDLTMKNQQIQEFEPEDQVLPVEGLVYAANLYAGGEDLENPLLSPLYGDLSNLGEFQLYIGTNEVLYPDCLLLSKKMAGAQGSSMDIRIEKGMMHDWIIFPFPESKQTVGTIAQFLLKE